MQPNVTLIGGPPGAGKTSLGTALAGRLGCPSLTIDDIRTGLLAVTTPASHPEMHVVGLPDAVTYFTGHKPTELLAHAEAQHRALWPAVERIVRKKESAGQSAVIEGWHLMPSLMASASFQHVHAVWIDVDHKVLEQRERNVWDFYARSPSPEIMFSNFLGRSTAWNDRVRNEARDNGFQVIHQDGAMSVADLVEELVI